MNRKRATQQFFWIALAFGTADPAHGEPPRVAVTSRSLASVSFDKETRTLEIEFRSGALYRYREVPEAACVELLRAESKGRFFMQRIRGKYPFTCVQKSKR